MKYLSAKEYSYKIGRTPEAVRYMLSAGRVPGAVKEQCNSPRGFRWLIPDNSVIKTIHPPGRPKKNNSIIY